jgi:hypothetical protein
VTALVAGPVAAYLAVRAPNRVDRALSVEPITFAPAPVDVVPAGQTGERLLPLWRLGPGDLSPATTIELLAGTYGTTPTVTHAELRIGTCVFTLAGARTVADGTTIPLTRQALCTDASSTSAELRLAVAGDGRLALWTWQVPPGAVTGSQGLTMTDPAAGAALNSVIRGRYGWDTGQPSPRRAALIAWLWNDASHAQTTSLLGLAVFALAFGVWLLTGVHIPVCVSMGAAGTGLVALGLAVLWAIILPPLQGADEADHLLSYGEVVGADRIAQTLDAEARRVHFERIRYHAMERFTASDRDTPHPVAWTGDIHAERMDARSPLTMRVWRLANAALGQHALVDQLLFLRLLNAVIFAGVVAGAVAFVVWAGAGRLWMMVGLALMPTLPYFATTLSDWAYLASWSTLLAASMVVLMHGGPRAAWAGVSLGVSLALSISTSIAAIALAPLALIAVIGRCVLRRDQTDETPRSLAIFWGGLAVGLLLAYLLMGDLLAQGYRRYDADGRGTFSGLLALVNRVVQIAAAHPWVALVLVAAGAGIDRICAGVRRHATTQRGGLLIGRTAGVALAIAGVVVGLGSFVLPMPHLYTLEAQVPASMWAYVRQAMEALVTSTRLRNFDHLTFASLWGGFGWVDAMLPPIWLALIAVALTVGVVTSAIRLWQSSFRTTATWFALLLVGGALSACTYAAAAFLMHRNLHGRYLLPLAIPIATIVMSELGLACAEARRPVWRWMAVVGVAALHGASFLVVASRYF